MSFACFRLNLSQTWQQAKAVMSFKAKKRKKCTMDFKYLSPQQGKQTSLCASVRENSKFFLALLSHNAVFGK